MATTPTGLASGGRSLWVSVTGEHELTAEQEVQLLEACRAKDRLDQLDQLLRGDVDVWAKLTHGLRTDDYELRIDGALSQANATATLLKQLLAALRLPDKVAGTRPQQRGGGRGAYTPTGAKVSSLERARARSAG